MSSKITINDCRVNKFRSIRSTDIPDGTVFYGVIAGDKTLFLKRYLTIFPLSVKETTFSEQSSWTVQNNLVVSEYEPVNIEINVLDK